MADAVVVYSDSDGQSVTDQLYRNNRPLPLTGLTVKFMMREANNDTLKVDETATIVDDPEEGNVKYDWDDPDIDEPGEYFAWWRVVNGAENIDIQEFLVIVTEHSPGLRTRTGVIYKRGRGIIPSTWDALEEDDDYGDAFLQDKIELVKLTVFGSAVAVGSEVTYDIRVQEFIAKVAVLKLIPTAIDYWKDSKITISATGTNESVTYHDRVAALKDIQKELMRQIAEDQPIIEDILDVPELTPAIYAPGWSPGTDLGFVTPLPGKHFRDYAFPGIRDDLYTGRD